MSRLPSARFPWTSRLLHWLMAVMVVAMLFIGVGMVSSESLRYRVLVSVHEPLGIAILILVIVRVVNRLLNPPPPLPHAMPGWQRAAASGSHYLLYALMFMMPLVGWGMLSAAPYPVVLFGSLRLPPILPQDAALYAWLRQLHTVLAYLFFATFLAHLGAALFHALVRRDGVFQSMAPRRRPAHEARQARAAAGR
jgi:cytochrome b561